MARNDAVAARWLLLILYKLNLITDYPMSVGTMDNTYVIGWADSDE